MASTSGKTIHIKSDETKIIDTEYSGKRENFEADVNESRKEHDRVINALLNCQGDYSNIKTALIREEKPGSGNRVLRLRFDMNNFAVTDITAKYENHDITIHGKAHKKTKEESISMEASYKFTMPPLVKMEMVRISLSVDGVLSVVGPLPPSEPIEI